MKNLAIIALEGLTSAGGRMTGDLKTKLGNGAATREGSVVLRSSVADQSGEIIILDETNGKIEGVSTFHEGRLPKGQAFGVARVRMAMKSDATSPHETSDEYNSVFSDPALYGSRVQVIQDGTVVFDQPVAKYHSAQGNNNPSNGFVEQIKGWGLGDAITSEIKVVTPKGKSIGANVYFELILDGLFTV